MNEIHPEPIAEIEHSITSTLLLESADNGFVKTVRKRRVQQPDSLPDPSKELRSPVTSSSSLLLAKRM
jgi:hypothetical protein